MGMKQIRLSKGLYALVSEQDFDFLNQWTWYASNESRGTKWYAIRREKGVKIRMHRVIAQRRGYEILEANCRKNGVPPVVGEWNYPIPEGMVVDHVNHNSLDNRRENLEVITQVENMKRSPGWKKRGMKLEKCSGY
jgi:hypothetical protein